MAFCPRCHLWKFISPTSGGLHKCTACGLEFKESVVITRARGVLYTLLIVAVLLLVGLGVAFAGCSLLGRLLGGGGRMTDFFERPPCRLKAALRLASERRLQAAAENPVLRPLGGRV
jgi:hypothetical protein